MKGAEESRDAYQVAVKLLSRREHSIQELRRKLARKEFSNGVIDAVVSNLQEADLVSDARYAEVFVRSRINRGDGPMKVLASLRERGIDDVLIDQFLHYDDTFWISRANRVLEKKFGQRLTRGDETGSNDWGKRARFLAGRGFAAEIIYRSLGPQHG
ncbi:MAG: regulatory protein RecX [Pseudomonadota bacterium]|uniref:Regulatory protein RecX n=1 Tax=marine metagenome TaxID=408172 RepID=A0A381PLV4_9ZZZZ|nr:RecX family transcriptional regulator [Gammaproteobacteria bacterium]MEC8867811.1 regulatory protein RecX [Pseudomonadota bacterium]MEC9240810.1 regulatory protein RecX [Pseudomonadota bacterium]HCP49258.1 RecX family transcriptional regulator [Gammaproteobacteria bacterium]|tara:strand:- start:987 stop:1457 length:471 start_codon:yes stop_codon:yes gene_type:complete